MSRCRIKYCDPDKPSSGRALCGTCRNALSSLRRKTEGELDTRERRAMVMLERIRVARLA